MAGSFYASQIFAIVVGFAAGGVTAALGYPAASGLVGRITGIVVFLTAASALVWAAVRMAPAAATSIEKRRFAFFEAWGVSRGLFWPMLGSFLLAVLPYYLVVLAIEFAALIIAADSMRPAFEAPSDAPAPDLAAFHAKFMQPEILAALLMTGAILIALSFLFHLTMIGINARVIMVDRARRAAA